MNATVALALRRGMVCLGAIGSSVVAHSLAGGGLRPTLMLPMALGLLTFLAMLVGARSNWRPRGAIGTGALLLALQPVVHIAVGAAPWLFGMSFHHEVSLLAPSMLLAHAAAIVVAMLLIAHVERIITASIAGVRAVLTAIVPPPRARSHGRGTPLVALVQAPPTRRARTGVSERGPPAALPLT